MKREHCIDCPALVDGDNGEWICDELEKEVEEVKHCPEWNVDAKE